VQEKALHEWENTRLAREHGMVEAEHALRGGVHGV
jgi:hypothetical protein